MTKLVPIMLAAALWAAPAAAQQPAASDSAAIAAEIQALMTKYADAVRTHDLTTLESLLAPDLWNIRPNGERHRKADVMQGLTSGTQKFTKYTSEPVVVHVHGNDVAVAVVRNNVAGPDHKGRPLPGQNTTARIWVKRDGRWQVVLTTISPITAGGAR